jgi:hypothetical protein
MKINKRAIGLSLLGIVAVLQFIRPSKNESNDQTNNIANKYPMSQDLKQVMEVACNDCHSNLTRYPWYTNIQPVGLWMADHVKEAKREINFSELGKRPVWLINHKMEEVIEMVKEGEMPLKSYTWTHGDAKLTEPQKGMITDWAQGVMDSLKANNPADSLIMPKRRSAPGK